LCCGYAAAVVAIAAETIKTVAMRVFHWNITPPSYIAHKSMPEMACGFRLRRGRGLHGAYMACDKFADHLLGRDKVVRMRAPGNRERGDGGSGVVLSGSSAPPLGPQLAAGGNAARGGRSWHYCCRCHAKK